MTRLVDREAEVRDLRELAGRPGRKLALLYGRRRIGKTHLLTHAWEDGTPVLYYTASATTPEINRRALLAEAGHWSGAELRPEDHPTWRTTFRSIFDLHPDQDAVVVLDEFQYLGTGSEGMAEVASELNAVWEGDLRRERGLLVVLSGSAVRTMRALEAGGSPLFGRLDWRRRLRPFDYFDAGLMVPGYGPEDRVRTYGAFGGTPMYLSLVDDDRPLPDNIIDLLLAPDGRVRLQVETALEQEEGLREVDTYRAILAAVGLKRRERGEIAAALGRPSDSGLQRMVKELVRLDYLEEERNFDAPSNQALRYRLADPAQRVYYGMALANESAVASAGPRTVWEERLAGATWPSYLGREVFEDVAGEAYLRRQREGGLPVVEEWGRWEGSDREGEPVEIDVVARVVDGRILSGAVKMSSRPVGARLWREHVRNLERLATSGHGWARAALGPDAPFFFVSAAGFTDAFRRSVAEERERPVIAWSVADLFG
ncbi:MAG TPA: ATP-binding protein [Gemmatimonadota bacterium]|nr:ATP-binding protein [Gemmatimonadota bacterium]